MVAENVDLQYFQNFIDKNTWKEFFKNLSPWPLGDPKVRCHATQWLINVMWPSRCCCCSSYPPMKLCNTRCLSVCLLELYVKTTDRIFMKILPEMHPWTRKNWLNFGSHAFRPFKNFAGQNTGFISAGWSNHCVSEKNVVSNFLR